MDGVTGTENECVCTKVGEGAAEEGKLRVWVNLFSNLEFFSVKPLSLSYQVHENIIT